MEKFAIIEALEEAAEALGWEFVFSLDAYSRALHTGKAYGKGVNVLIADVKFNPDFSGSNVGEVSYTCLIMLGRKFDSDGRGASYDEYDSQKYTRRLKGLVVDLCTYLGNVACANELEVNAGTITPAKNMFPDNLDFAIANNVTFSTPE